MKKKYLTPDSEWSETISMLALADSGNEASLEDFDSNFDTLEW